MLQKAETYEQVRNAFTWEIPEYINMGVAVCDRHAEAGTGRPALIFENENGDITEYSFQALKGLSNKLANLFVAKGLKPGDRVGILLPRQRQADGGAQIPGLVL